MTDRTKRKKYLCLPSVQIWTERKIFPICPKLDRKDNIFITRKEPENHMDIEILNYAREVKRNDIKKSEVFFSYFIQGTAPRYEYIQALEDSLCEA